MCLSLFLVLAGGVPASAQSERAESAIRELRPLVASIAGLGNPARVDRANELLEEVGLSPQVQPFSSDVDGESLDGRNIVVTLKGRGSSSAKLVVGAHVDASPLGDGTISLGAVDNAAGTVIVLELARLMAARSGDDRLLHDVDFVLFDLEERGFLGSEHYLSASPDAQVSAMINVDIGTSGTTVIFGPEDAAGNEPLYRLASSACTGSGTRCMSFPKYPPSDERSFQARDVPNISFAIVPEVEAHQLWLLLNGGADSGLGERFVPLTVQAIHTPKDTMELVEEGALQTLVSYLEVYLKRVDQEFAGSG